MWTSKAYAHSTEESVGDEWEEGDTNTRLAKNLWRKMISWHHTLEKENDEPKKSRAECTDEEVISQYHHKG